MLIRILFVLFSLLLPFAHAQAHGKAHTKTSTDDNIATIPMKAVKVGPHSYFVQGLPGAASSENQGFMSNAGFVVTRDGVVVFDALGSPPLTQKLVSLIKQITKQPIKRVIVSHYHADHYYGLEVFKALGAEIWAHQSTKGVIHSVSAKQRFEQRKEALFPWVDDNTKLLEPDRYLTGNSHFDMGGVHFVLNYVGPAHSDEDLVMLVKQDGVLYAGDLVFLGRIPFVGDADAAAWVRALDKLLAMKPRVLVPGHGPASVKPAADLVFTRDYLKYLRSSMSKAASELVPFDEAYAKTDWTRYRKVPTFNEANRANAYNQYLRLEASGGK